MSLVSSQLPMQEAFAASASGTSSQPPPQLLTTNHGTHVQPAKATPPEKVSNLQGQSAKSASVADVPHLSTSTQEFLKRIGEKPSAYVAAREIVLKGMVTTPQTMPLPSTAVRGARRGGGRGSRGGRSSLATTPTTRQAKQSTATPSNPTPPVSTRGSSRSRASGRSRGRGGGRPSKRKRAGSEDSEGSDISASYTPLATTTKSGRNVQKPTQFSPIQPSSPPSGTKRRRGGRRISESSVCKVCRRGYSPDSNMIVFCDGCNTPYHQYCHDPRISDEVIAILDQEWFCTACVQSKESSPTKEQDPSSVKPRVPSPMKTPPAPTLHGGVDLSYEQKLAYLSALPKSELVSLLLSASQQHPDLPLFESTAHQLWSRGNLPTPPTTQPPQSNDKTNSYLNDQSGLDQPSVPPVQQGHNTTSRSELTTSYQGVSLGKRKTSISADSQSMVEADEPSEEYDSDPPAHFPKPGNGLPLPSDNDVMHLLIDDNFEVFSHIYKVDDGRGVLNGEKDAYAVTAR